MLDVYSGNIHILLLPVSPDRAFQEKHAFICYVDDIFRNSSHVTKFAYTLLPIFTPTGAPNSSYTAASSVGIRCQGFTEGQFAT